MRRKTERLDTEKIAGFPFQKTIIFRVPLVLGSFYQQKTTTIGVLGCQNRLGFFSIIAEKHDPTWMSRWKLVEGEL